MGANPEAFAVIICTRCRDPRNGALAAQALIDQLLRRSEATTFAVETVACMAGCDRPLAVAFRGKGRATYLFGDIEPDADAEALLQFSRVYEAAPTGWSNESQRPSGLKGKTLARIPASS